MTVWLSDRLTETSRLITIQTTSCLSFWQHTDRLIERLSVSLPVNRIDGNQINWLPAYMIDRLTGWCTVHCTVCWSTLFSLSPSVLPSVWPSYQNYYLTYWQTNQLTDCLSDCLSDINRHLSWLTDLLNGNVPKMFGCPIQWQTDNNWTKERQTERQTDKQKWLNRYSIKSRPINSWYKMRTISTCICLKGPANSSVSLGDSSLCLKDKKLMWLWSDNVV